MGTLYTRLLPTEPSFPETKDHVFGKWVESTTLICDSSLLSAPDTEVPDDKASSPDLLADESAVPVIPAVQWSAQGTGTVKPLIGMGIPVLKVATLLDTGAGASPIGDAIFE